MKVVWLASYPKSGNTWIRFFLYSYFFGPIRESAEVDRAIPGIHRLPGSRLPNKGEGRIFCKTHFLWSRQHPNYDDTVGSIYMLRHPKDVLLSNINYFNMVRDRPLDEISFCTRFIDEMGVPSWRRAGMGNWVEHVNSWLTDPSPPKVVIRYEDALRDPHAVFGGILRFLGAEIDEARLREAISASTFDKLRSLEDRERSGDLGHTAFPVGHAGVRTGRRFFNRGRAGQTLEHISAEVDRRFDERFADVLRPLGYGADPPSASTPLREPLPYPDSGE